MNSSILNDVKKYLGPSSSYTAFDPDIIMNINAAFFTLFQLGVGNGKTAFTISDAKTTWTEFSFDEAILSAVKQYVYLKVRLVFDPPATANVATMYQDQIRELEWRLREAADWPVIASRHRPGCVKIGHGFNKTKDGILSVEDIPPLRRQFVEDLIDQFIGPDPDKCEEGDDSDAGMSLS